MLSKVNLRLRGPSTTETQIILTMWPAAHVMFRLSKSWAGGLVCVRSGSDPDHLHRQLHDGPAANRAGLEPSPTGNEYPVAADLQELHDLATQDHPAHLPNRQPALKRLRTETALGKRPVRDTCSHQVGELALCAGTNTLQETVRSDQFLGRDGGEELLHPCACAWATRQGRLQTRMPSRVYSPERAGRAPPHRLSGSHIDWAGETLEALLSSAPTGRCMGQAARAEAHVSQGKFSSSSVHSFCGCLDCSSLPCRDLTAARKNLAVPYSGARLRAR